MRFRAQYGARPPGKIAATLDAIDRRARAIEESNRALVNRRTAVLLLPVRLVDGRLQRILQVAFDDGSTQLMTQEGAQALQRELRHLLMLLDGHSPT